MWTVQPSIKNDPRFPSLGCTLGLAITALALGPLGDPARAFTLGLGAAGFGGALGAAGAAAVVVSGGSSPAAREEEEE